MAGLQRGKVHSMAILCAVAALMQGLPAAAQTAAGGVLAGKQINFVTMGGPGGGYDTYLRTLAPHLEKRTGARFIPVNQTGAGGLIAMNKILYAAPDGLTIGLMGGEALVTSQLYKLKGVNYDVRKLVWIARISAEDKVLLFAANTHFPTLFAMVKSDRPIIWAGTGMSDGNSDFSAILAHATGMKSKIVIGYKGTGGINLAIERGEADGRVVSDESASRATRSGKLKVVAVLAREKSGKFPSVPTVFEQLKLSEEATRLIEWRAGIAALGRLILTAPGAPADRVDALRLAFKEVLADPAVIAEIKKRSLSPDYASGEKVKGMVDKTLGMLDEAGLKQIREKILTRYF